MKLQYLGLPLAFGLVLTACGAATPPTSQQRTQESKPVLTLKQVPVKAGQLTKASLPKGYLACFYEDVNYQGNGFCVVTNADPPTSGDFALNWIGEEFNDKISSVRVADGTDYPLTLWPDADFRGDSGVPVLISEDVPDLGALNFDNVLSSFDVFRP